MTLLLLFLLLALATSFACSLWEAVLLSITPSFVSEQLASGRRGAGSRGAGSRGGRGRPGAGQFPPEPPLQRLARGAAAGGAAPAAGAGAAAVPARLGGVAADGGEAEILGTLLRLHEPLVNY